MSSLFRNVLKANQIKEEEAKIIDYNDVISEKIESIRRQLLIEQGFGDPSGVFSAGLAAPVVEIEPPPDPEEELAKARAEAEGLLSSARAEAEEVRSRAAEEAVALREQEKEAGWQQGYNEGYQNGSNQAQEELDAEKQRLTKEENRRQEEYRQRLNQMEKELVDVISEVVSHVTSASLTEKRDIILHLIENALEQSESSRQFLIHVSKEDYPTVSDQKERLLSQVPQSTELDIIRDATLMEGQCMIETDGGVFDCGLDTQLSSLIADIKALSIQ